MSEQESKHTDEANNADMTDKAYRRAARLLAQKLGVDWRTLDPEAVREYMRKISIARGKHG